MSDPETSLTQALEAGSRAASLLTLVEQRSDGSAVLRVNTPSAAGGPVDLVVSPEDLRDHTHSLDNLRGFLFTHALTVVDPTFAEGWDGRHLRQAPAPPEPEGAPGPTPYPTEISSALASGRDVMVFGKSASGKTVAAQVAARSLRHEAAQVFWLDFSLTESRVLDFVAVLAGCDLHTKVVLFVDDAQASPGEAAKLERLRRHSELSPAFAFQIVMIAWQSARRAIQELWPSASVVNVLPDRAMAAVMAPLKNSPLEDREQLARLLGGDLVAATSAVRFYQRESRLPNADELAFEELSAITKDAALDDSEARVLLTASALAQFEIDTSTTYLEQLSADGTKALLDRRALRRAGDYISLGHRSTARLVYRALMLRLPELAGATGEPAKLALDYLQGASSIQLINTLDRLDIAALQRTGSEQHGTRFLARLWSSLQSFLNALDRYAERDPSWRDDTGSAAFAARSLAYFGKASAAGTIQHLRGRWTLESTVVPPHPLDPPPNERKDFGEIRRCMGVEDSAASTITWQKADDLDFDRMHRTWALGLLLAVETAPEIGNPDRVETLRQIAESIQHPSGAFYPERVPWVTARVLMGLSQAGEQLGVSNVTALGCNWLLTESPRGPFNFGAWQPNTGSWNSIVGTSAMCVNALLRCGVSPSVDQVELALNYLISRKEEWSRPGREIDAAFVIEAFLIAGIPWREFSPELRGLIEWAEDPALWEAVVLDAEQAKDESLKVPLIVTVLLGIIWEIVRAELPLLLEDLAFGALLPPSPSIAARSADAQTLLLGLDEIRASISRNIDDRSGRLSRSTPGAEAIRQQLETYRDAARRAENVRVALERVASSLESEQGGVTLEQIRLEVNTLGAEVLGAGWTNL